MRTYEERARYILKQRDERLAKRRRIRTAVTMSAVSVCSLALIVGVSVAIKSVIGKNGAVWISSTNASSGGGGAANSRVTAPAAELVYNEGDIHSTYKFTMPEFPDVDFAIDNGVVTADGKKLFGGQMTAAVFLADLNGDGCRELCTDWGVSAPTTPLDMGISAYDYSNGEYYALSDPTGSSEYHLLLEDGKLKYKYYLVLKDQSIERKGEFTLSDMRRVSEPYFISNGQNLIVEKIYDQNDHPNPSEPFEFTIPEFPGVNFKLENYTVYANGRTLYSGMPISTVYLADLNGDGYRELCSDIAFGSGIVDERIGVYDYANSELYELSDRGKYDYALSLEDRILKYKRYAYSVKSGDTTEETGVLTLSVMKRVEDNGDKSSPPVEKLYPRDNKDVGNILELNDDFEFTIPEVSGSFKLVKGVLSRDGEFLLQGYPIHSIYLADLDGDGVREVIAEYSVGYSGVLDMNIFAYDPKAKESYKLDAAANEEYVLTLENGVLGYKHCVYSSSGITTDEQGELTLSVLNKLCGLPKADPQP